ncbi:RloB family protein [Corynebacterium glutamicum]|uniref:RloB family protein n=1 Tax=Corynebacterium glutamicum TaxID=1718 RepID=UPI00117D4BB7|nr:RloB family protein [Corynebacterium glutamicum]QDQ19953.1 RloB domain-containing protein [Corynebacterium glutamicum]QDQ23520.1 RloB domain-containing protein [Corynebacterium glutamicum]
MKRQIENLKKDDLRPGDQAWVVFDQDNRGQDLIELVWDWSKERPKDRGVGFSSPQFEWWLLLHFEEGSGAFTQKEILSRLELYIPAYTKGRADQLPHGEQEFQQTIRRAKSKVPNLPQDFSGTRDILGGFTTVHFLVERILQAVKASSK